MPGISTTLKGNNMTRKLATALAIATTAAAAAAFAAIASGKAYADDITVDKTPFVSSKSRAEVRAELMGQSELLRYSANEWAMQNNRVPQVKSDYPSEQAKAEYKASRQYVGALTGEDSGSAYFKMTPGRASGDQ